MLLDDLMPTYDVVERHRTVVHAPPNVIYASLREADLGGGAITAALLALRAAPAALVSFVRAPNGARADSVRRVTARAHGIRLRDFEEQGFRVVAERPPEELVIGLLGRFWTPGGGLRSDVSADTFRAGPPAGLALAGWNFTVHALSDGASELRTETRVLCADDARWKFRLYWIVVRPGSGLIRRAMLGAIGRHAERRGAAVDQAATILPPAV